MKEEAYLEEFFTEIMEAEEFGEADSKRMVAMRGTGWIDYIREFHHQMHLSHPKAGQYKILYPILWVRTFSVLYTATGNFVEYQVLPS